MTSLRVSGLEAAFELVGHCARFSVSIEDAVRQLRSGPADNATLDYGAAIQLLDVIGTELLSTDDIEARREIARAIVDAERPPWRLAAARGRKWCIDALDSDTRQALAWARLVDADPDPTVVAWWDSLAAEVRGLADSAKLLAGREGERLTMRYERDRLARIGILDREPRWRAVEDNTLGYDVESWDWFDGRVTQLRIEVKAFSDGMPHFFLSREEWNTAERFVASYVFDIWDLSRQRLQRIPSARLAAWVPDDSRASEWRSALVRVRSL